MKAVDDISLVEDGVLLIAATNYPQLLDHAAWRRFDNVMNFVVPDEEMRRRIFEKILEKVDATIDLAELARLTDRYTGSDLRIVVREAVLSALLQDRKKNYTGGPHPGYRTIPAKKLRLPPGCRG